MPRAWRGRRARRAGRVRCQHDWRCGKWRGEAPAGTPSCWAQSCRPCHDRMTCEKPLPLLSLALQGPSGAAASGRRHCFELPRPPALGVVATRSRSRCCRWSRVHVRAQPHRTRFCARVFFCSHARTPVDSQSASLSFPQPSNNPHPSPLKLGGACGSIAEAERLERPARVRAAVAARAAATAAAAACGRDGRQGLQWRACAAALSTAARRWVDGTGGWHTTNAGAAQRGSVAGCAPSELVACVVGRPWGRRQWWVSGWG